MHPEVRQPSPGKRPKCGMDLRPEGMRFAMLRCMGKSPMIKVILVLIMAAIIYIVFMQRDSG
jgi:hypothetical protein